MVFGWGQKSKEWPLDNGRFLVASWSYVSFLLCPVSRSTRWFIVGDKRSEDHELSKQQLEQMFPEGRPQVPLWSRYGFWMVFGSLFVIGFIMETFFPGQMQ
jgi:hypothetical protein